MNDDQPIWDRDLADRLRDAVVLVGVTFHGPDGVRLDQFYGTIVEAREGEGVTLRLGGSRSGEAYRLPPDLEALSPASPGTYRLKQSGDVVNDPDYIATWDVHSPGN